MVHDEGNCMQGSKMGCLEFNRRAAKEHRMTGLSNWLIK